MATLVLTAAGQAIGGRIGAAVGALIGQQVDSRLFGRKARHGPRLGDLSVQTSSYGSQIPKLFGTMRVAGTVVWATDLREERAKSGGGKSQPKTVNYSYSANFAVLLSAREVHAVRRIWADGKLLRGAAGDFKTATKFRLHPGGEDQAPDPLIASVEGAGTPAYRGLAYAVFEDFELAEYGNRIPSLTFEVEADVGPVSAGEIAAALAPGDVAADEAVAVAGYAASGDSVRGAIEALADLEPLSLTDDGAILTLAQAGAGEALLLGADELETSAEGAGGPSEWSRRSGDAVPVEATLAYYEPSRDYQGGLQRASRGGTGLRSDRRAVAAALSADTAKALAERRLETLWAERRSAKVHLPPRRIGIAPGNLVRTAEGSWRVSRTTLEHMVLTLELLGIPGDATFAPAASAGTGVAEPDLVHGPTRLVLLDLPLGGEDLPARPRLLVAAAGEAEGWRRAQLMASEDGGESWAAAGETAPAATIGVALEVPGASGSALLDLSGSLVVELASDAMWLESRSDAALAASANLAALGDELIQFGVVEPIGPRRFRLSRLLRGHRGTEWAAAGHAPGEAFVLIEAETLAAVPFGAAALGGEARLLATGLGDPQGVAASRPLSGEALRPPSPVHLRARRLPGGDVEIAWVRRSRSGWVWLSGSDTPLGEETERYLLAVSAGAIRREVETEAPAFLYTAAALDADGLTGTLLLEVAQLGTSAPSRPALLILDQGD